MSVSKNLIIFFVVSFLFIVVGSYGITHPTKWVNKYDNVTGVIKKQNNKYELRGGSDDSYWIADNSLDIKFDAPLGQPISVEVEQWKYPFSWDIVVHRFSVHAHSKDKEGNLY